MKTVLPLLLTFVLLSVQSVLAAPQTNAPTKSPMPAKQPTVAGRINKLSQYCALFGNIVIYFENDKFLLQTIESDMYVLYSPPYDNLYYYSKRTKKLCVVPAKGFVNQFTKSRTILTGVVLASVPLVKDKEEMVKDLKCVCYKSTAEFGKNAHKIYHNREAGGASPREVKAHYYKVKDMDVRLPLMIAKLLDLPAIDALPIDFQYKSIEDAQSNYLNYGSFAQTVAPPKLFEIPTKLPIVKSPQEVLQGVEEEDAMELMMLDSARLKKK